MGLTETTSEKLLQGATRFAADLIRDHTWLTDADKGALAAGALAAEAAHQINQAKHIKVTDADSLSISGYTINVHEKAMASQIKGSLALGSHYQFKALIRLLLADAMELDADKPEDWEAVDLAWVVRD